MKLVSIFLVILVMVNCCFGQHRRLLVDKAHVQHQQQVMEKGTDVQVNSQLGYSGSSTSNHHSIPRQQYSGYNNGSGQQSGSGGDGDNSGGGGTTD
ncbi:hypothetical protein QJS10_CPB21g00357 [Acorus calamus]|uniref:Uncharacterized protein n=1 Tax=Acorus calamus TaxID=4465 RepID=A0AAV9C5W9_ACOCL|nr:hypothetical protein QJS10_CPB21g00357 [Acorus calamus]